jgi:hypothetical protein
MAVTEIASRIITKINGQKGGPKAFLKGYKSENPPKYSTKGDFHVYSWL